MFTKSRKQESGPYTSVVISLLCCKILPSTSVNISLQKFNKISC